MKCNLYKMYLIYTFLNYVLWFRLAEVIRDSFADLDDIKLNSITMDFEKGLISAFKNTFEDVKIIGCDFHWKKCLRENIRAHGLLPLHDSDEEFHKLVRTLWALSLIPLGDLIKTYQTRIQNVIKENLKNNNNWAEYLEEIKSFFLYFNRGKPMFDYGLWNKHDSVLMDLPSTNNFCEGYNNAFKRCLPANASVWVLIDRFREEDSMVN